MKYRLGDQPEAGKMQLGGQVPQFGGFVALSGGGGATSLRAGRSSQIAAASSGGGIEPRPPRGGGGTGKPRTSIP